MNVKCRINLNDCYDNQMGIEVTDINCAYNYKYNTKMQSQSMSD